MARSKAGGTACLALAVSAALLLGGCVGAGTVPKDVDCADGKPEKVKLKIKLKDGVPHKVVKDDGNDGDNGEDANTISVCPGDEVVWKLDGSEFTLQFKDTSAGKLPFEWPDGTKKASNVGNGKWKLIDVVRADVDYEVPLKYDVFNPKGRFDPLIIVER